MKSIAYVRLEFDFPDASITLESRVGERITDVLVTFDRPREPYGNGIAVEVQYRNHGKDVEDVTAHYLKRDYSVVWLDETDFSEEDVDLSGVLTVWPCALPDRTGLKGYSDVVRWLRENRSPSVELEVPLPAEYWMSFDKSDEWVTIGHRYLRQRGRAWIMCSRSPTDQLTLQIGKKERGWEADAHRVTVQLERDDCATLRSFSDTLAEKVFGGERPSEEVRDYPWHDLHDCVAHRHQACYCLALCVVIAGWRCSAGAWEETPVGDRSSRYSS